MKLRYNLSLYRYNNLFVFSYGKKIFLRKLYSTMFMHQIKSVSTLLTLIHGETMVEPTLLLIYFRPN